MPSNFDLLRQGHAVEVEPGLSGKLNQKNKTLELSSGEVLNVGHNKNFFPSQEKDVKLSKQKEYAEKKAKGTGGEFFHQFSSGGIPGSISDIGAYLTQSGDEYVTRKQAQNEVSERISEESPYTSGAATGANIAIDFGLTRGMSALKAAPLLTAGSSGSRLLTEPGEVAQDALIAAGGGYVLDKVTGGLGRAASRRGAARELPARQEAVRNSNIIGKQAVEDANALQTQQFNMLKQNTKSVNESRLKQFKDDLSARENQIIQEKNAFEQKKFARDAEIVRLKNQAETDKLQRSANAAKSDAEYWSAKQAADQENKRMTEKFKLDQAQYEKDLKELPELQKKAQAEHGANVVKNAAQIERSFPKSSRIQAEELGVANFIEDSINQSGLAGSREASQAKRVLTALFPEGELIGGRELAKKYKALEDSIQRATPEVQSVLNNFKNHLGERLPVILENSIAFHKIMPLLQRTIKNDVKSVVNGLGLDLKMQNKLSTLLETKVFNTVKRDLRPSNFIEKVQSGELAREIANSVGSAENFLVDLTPQNIKFLQKQGTLPLLMNEANRQHAFFVQELTQKIQSRLSKYELKAMESARGASQKLGKDIKSTYGLAEPVPRPSAPVAPEPIAAPPMPGELPPIGSPQIPPPISPPQAPPMPGRPNLMTEPVAPNPQQFNPMAEPTLPPAQGMAERAGDLLEKPLISGSRGLLDNTLKLGGLKYLLGKAALPIEGAYSAAKVLTSPTAAGEVARMTFKQGGIQAIESWAQRYPSYHDGILENPQERRSLTKEIEDAYDIPIEQKAILQSKVNRGKPIQEKL